MIQVLPGEEAFSLDQGCWAATLRSWPRSTPRRPTLFLDRDGVMVEEVHYLRRPEDIRVIEGAARVIARANRQEIPVVIVTNQSGVGHGHYDWETFAEVQQAILTELAADGAFVDAVLACPYHPKGLAPYAHSDSPARKPNPGMLLHATIMLPIDLGTSWIVGDRASDLEAGRRAGLAGGVHVLTGYGEENRRAALMLNDGHFQVEAATSIAEAEDLIPLLRTTGS